MMYLYEVGKKQDVGGGRPHGFPRGLTRDYRITTCRCVLSCRGRSSRSTLLLQQPFIFFFSDLQAARYQHTQGSSKTLDIKQPTMIQHKKKARFCGSLFFFFLSKHLFRTTNTRRTKERKNRIQHFYSFSVELEL